MTIGNTQKIWLCGFQVMQVMTDRQTDKHTHRNTSHPSWGEVYSSISRMLSLPFGPTNGQLLHQTTSDN